MTVTVFFKDRSVRALVVRNVDDVSVIEGSFLRIAVDKVSTHTVPLDSILYVETVPS